MGGPARRDYRLHTMKKPASLLVALAASTALLLNGCASAPATKPVSQQELMRKDIEQITKVEIFYHPSEYAIVDLGGSDARGLAGAFGFFGLMAGLALDAGSKLTYQDRAEARSKEFTALMKDQGTPDLNAIQAERLAELIRQSGREVVITSTKRPSQDLLKMDVTPASGDQNASASTSPTNDAGTARLILRVSAGYGAESAMAVYHSMVLTDAVLRDANGKRLITLRLEKQNSGETYRTFEGLKSSAPDAMAVLKKDALAQAEHVYEGTFDLPKLTAAVASK